MGNIPFTAELNCHRFVASPAEAVNDPVISNWSGNDVVFDSVAGPKLFTGQRIKTKDFKFLVNDEFGFSFIVFSEAGTRPAFNYVVVFPNDFASFFIECPKRVAFDAGVDVEQVTMNDWR